MGGDAVMKRYELIVIGAGPAGLSAAIEAAKAGMEVAVFDENAGPGGQLFKQIHKFFGSKEHDAKMRGFRIGQKLLAEAEEYGVKVFLNAVVMGIYDQKEVLVKVENEVHHYKGDNIVIATGAAENMIPFKGWNKPGVMGAGASQALMHLQGVKPGNKVMVVGSGNVGLIVAFQVMQVGCELVAVLDAAPRVGGYGVHIAKITRTGAPFLASHTIIEAKGEEKVESAVIAEVDDHFKPVPGTEKEIEVDTILLAVGLTPMSQLASNAGCLVEYREQDGRISPVTVVDEYGETTVPGIYCCGDSAKETAVGAPAAMIQGRVAAARMAEKAGYITAEDAEKSIDANLKSLDMLSGGFFSVKNKGRTDIKTTEEGYALSESLLRNGYIKEEELKAFPAASYKVKGIHPVIECTQNIPCNPCSDACKFNCILMDKDIVKLPEINHEAKCGGCGMCVTACSGQAIFLINEDHEPGYATVGLPYEFLPYPEKGTKGMALDRSGKPVCEAEVVSCRITPAMDKTAVLTMKVPLEYVNSARFFKAKEA